MADRPTVPTREELTVDELYGMLLGHHEVLLAQVRQTELLLARVGRARAHRPTDVIPQCAPKPVPMATCKAVLAAVAEASGIGRPALLGHDNTPRTARIRQSCYAFMAEFVPGASAAAIGRRMERDPTTVMHGLHRYRRELRQADDIAQLRRAVAARLGLVLEEAAEP